MRSLPSFLLVVAAFVFGSGGCRARSSQLPEPPDPACRHGSARRRGRSRCPAHRGEACRRAGTNGRHQQSRRRRRHDRRRAGRQIGPGRLHPAVEYDRDPRHRPAHLRKPALRPGEGFFAGHPDREIALDHGGQCRASRPVRQGRDRAGEGQAGRTHLLLRGQRRRAASCRRNVQEPHRHRTACTCPIAAAVRRSSISSPDASR